MTYKIVLHRVEEDHNLPRRSVKLWRKHELQIVQVYNPKPKAKIRTDIDKNRTVKLLMKNEEDKNKITKKF